MKKKRKTESELYILVANNQLDALGGSETFTYTLIEELNKNTNYYVEYFCFVKGYVSKKIEKDLQVSFMSRNKYDLILANHNTTVNKLHKKGLTIQTCHGIYPNLEQPSKKADAYVSISQEIQDHLNSKGFSSKIIYNSIDVTRFYPKVPINKKLTSVLSLCHSNDANLFIKNICKDLNLKYYEAYKYGNAIWDVENKINQVDLVIGLGRSAYEAMSCGRPVIIFDKRTYFSSYADGYVKSILGFSLLNNCSGRYSKQTFSSEDLKKELKKYNYKDQDFFRNFALKHLDVRKNAYVYINYAKEVKELRKQKLLYNQLNAYLTKKIKKLKKRIKLKLKSILINLNFF